MILEIALDAAAVTVSAGFVFGLGLQFAPTIERLRRPRVFIGVGLVFVYASLFTARYLDHKEKEPGGHPAPASISPTFE